jgi:hypothetical protein
MHQEEHANCGLDLGKVGITGCMVDFNGYLAPLGLGLLGTTLATTVLVALDGRCTFSGTQPETA